MRVLALDPRSYKAALALRNRYGDDALLFAAMGADRSLKQGNFVRLDRWLRIIRAIQELQSTAAGGPLH